MHIWSVESSKYALFLDNLGGPGLREVNRIVNILRAEFVARHNDKLEDDLGTIGSNFFNAGHIVFCVFGSGVLKAIGRHSSESHQ
jgi:hypothetical protein